MPDIPSAPVGPPSPKIGPGLPYSAEPVPPEPAAPTPVPVAPPEVADGPASKAGPTIGGTLKDLTSFPSLDDYGIDDAFMAKMERTREFAHDLAKLRAMPP